MRIRVQHATLQRVVPVEDDLEPHALFVLRPARAQFGRCDVLLRFR